MTIAAEPSSKLAPGATGWTLADLENDPAAARMWDLGHYEIIEGVLAAMPPSYFGGSSSLNNLTFLLQTYFHSNGETWRSGAEPDLVLAPTRVVRPDMVFLSPADLRRQKAAHLKHGKKKKLTYGRILIAPTLIIESLSMDHELHDTDTKRRWYAQAGIPNYWLLNAYNKTLQCLILDGANYRLDVAGKKNAIVRPAAFPDLIIDLSSIWG